MNKSVLDMYIDYINTISDEQLLDELKKSGLEDYLIESEESFDMPSFTTNDTDVYTINAAETCYKSIVSNVKVTISQSISFDFTYQNKTKNRLDKICA